jgi:hypothetical protein
MKRFFTFITIGFFCSHISAQQLTNGGFETWTGGNPASWTTSHSCLPASTLESQETSIVYQGISAIRLVSGTLPAPASMPYAGFAHYGTGAYDNSLQDFVLNGVALSVRPDSLQFAYRYNPANTDSANVFCNFYSGSIGNIIGIVNVNLGGTAAYKLVTIPVTYLSSQPFDSFNLTFYSGSLYPVASGSTMYLDGVRFIFNGLNTGIEQTTEAELKVYPNPAASKLYFNISDKLIGNSVKIINMLGSEVMSDELMNTRSALDVSRLDAGIYLYRIVDTNNKTVYTGKFNKE